MPLSFDAFQKENHKRSTTLFGHETWPVQNWLLAIAGESGEACNLMKKVLRGDFTLEQAREELLKELADVMIYCDLCISELKANTEDTIVAKFNEVSVKRGYDKIL